MPVSENFALMQLLRFSAFPGFPRTGEGLAASAHFLAGLARSEAHCEALMTRLFEHGSRFPLPVDMRAAAQEEFSATAEWQPAPAASIVLSDAERAEMDARWADLRRRYEQRAASLALTTRHEPRPPTPAELDALRREAAELPEGEARERALRLLEKYAPEDFHHA